jgi:hypothetical protein
MWGIVTLFVLYFWFRANQAARALIFIVMIPILVVCFGKFWHPTAWPEMIVYLGATGAMAWLIAGLPTWARQIRVPRAERMDEWSSSGSADPSMSARSAASGMPDLRCRSGSATFPGWRAVSSPRRW